MASRRIEDLATPLQKAWAEGLEEWHQLYPDLAEPFLTCTYRSNAEQQQLYDQGRSKPGKIVTKAKPGQSKHNVMPSNAFDIAFIIQGRLDWDSSLFAKFAALVKKKGVKWGGDFKTFKDRPHFEI